jgi:hypothetical protein
LDAAVSSGAFGVGATSNQKVNAMYANLNAHLQAANMAKKYGDRSLMPPQVQQQMQGLQDTIHSLTGQLKLAPDKIHSALNNTYDNQIHNYINDKWTDLITAKVEAYKTNAANKPMLDQNGGSVPAALIKQWQSDPNTINSFIKTFKQFNPYQPKDAKGNVINEFMPPPPPGVRTAIAPAPSMGKVTKFGKQPADRLVPPPAPYNLNGVMPPGVPTGSEESGESMPEIGEAE